MEGRARPRARPRVGVVELLGQTMEFAQKGKKGPARSTRTMTQIRQEARESIGVDGEGEGGGADGRGSRRASKSKTPSLVSVNLPGIGAPQHGQHNHADGVMEGALADHRVARNSGEAPDFSQGFFATPKAASGPAAAAGGGAIVSGANANGPAHADANGGHVAIADNHMGPARASRRQSGIPVPVSKTAMAMKALTDPMADIHPHGGWTKIQWRKGHAETHELATDGWREIYLLLRPREVKLTTHDHEATEKDKGAWIIALMEAVVIVSDWVEITHEELDEKYVEIGHHLVFGDTRPRTSSRRVFD